MSVLASTKHTIAWRSHARGSDAYGRTFLKRARKSLWFPRDPHEEIMVSWLETRSLLEDKSINTLTSMQELAKIIDELFPPQGGRGHTHYVREPSVSRRSRRSDRDQVQRQGRTCAPACIAALCRGRHLLGRCVDPRHPRRRSRRLPGQEAVRACDEIRYLQRGPTWPRCFLFILVPLRCWNEAGTHLRPHVPPLHRRSGDRHQGDHRPARSPGIRVRYDHAAGSTRTCRMSRRSGMSWCTALASP